MNILGYDILTRNGAVVSRWRSLGLLGGLEGYRAQQLATMYEACAQMLICRSVDGYEDFEATAIFPVLYLLYTQKGYTNYVHILDELRAFYVSHWPIPDISGIDMEAELVAMFCDTYTYKEGLFTPHMEQMQLK